MRFDSSTSPSILASPKAEKRSRVVSAARYPTSENQSKRYRNFNAQDRVSGEEHKEEGGDENNQPPPPATTTSTDHYQQEET
ncbi:unnamed protein product [Trichobilharzia regenti]|nr:unnamed protein product [Trichobilharzia regenti]